MANKTIEVDSLVAGLKAAGQFNIHGVGKFKVKDRPARMGRNPATGEPVQIKARKVISFTPSSVLRDQINS